MPFVRLITTTAVVNRLVSMLRRGCLFKCIILTLLRAHRSSSSSPSIRMLRRKSKAERKFDLARGKKASSPVPGSAARLPLSPVSSNTRHNSFSEASPAKRPSLATRAKSKAKSAIKKGGAVSSVLSPRLSPRFSPRGPRHTLPNDGSKEHDECILEDSRYEARHFDIENELASTIASKEVNTPPPPAAPSPEATPLPVLKSSITPKQLQTTPATNKAFSVEDAQRVIAQGTVRMRGERLKTKIQEEEVRSGKERLTTSACLARIALLVAFASPVPLASLIADIFRSWQVIKLTRTPAKPPAKKEEEPRLVASQDSMTTNQAPSPPLVETAPAFTPVPDEASEELGSGIIKDFLTTPSPPSPPSPPTPEAGAPLPSTAWAKTTLEPANARTDHNEELDSLEKVRTRKRRQYPELPYVK